MTLHVDRSPFISEDQRRKLEDLSALAQSINLKINLYSRASARSFRIRHVEHSLTLAIKAFPQGSTVVDWGTGGGMPGLPLAILFPKVEFILIDAVSKKIQAIQTMARRLELNNVDVWHGRAETWDGSATHSVSRATAPLTTLWAWHERVATERAIAGPNEWQPGLICLKGGNLDQEVADLLDVSRELQVITTPLKEFNRRDAFEEKVIVEVYRH